MFLFKYIRDKWEAQKRAKMEEEARKIAADIVMSVIDVTEPNDKEAELLKMKVTRILLREETQDYNHNKPEDDNLDPSEVLNVTQPSDTEAESPKMQMTEVSLKQEIEDYNYNELEIDNWNPPQFVLSINSEQ